MKRILKISLWIVIPILVLWTALTLWVQLSGRTVDLRFGPEQAERNVLIAFNPDPIYDFDEQLCVAFAQGLAERGIASRVIDIHTEVLEEPDMFVLLANTYNWSPDWGIVSFAKEHILPHIRVVPITIGAGSTEAAQQGFEQSLKEIKAYITEPRSFWLLRQNDDARMNEDNIEVAKDMVLEWSRGLPDRLYDYTWEEADGEVVFEELGDWVEQSSALNDEGFEVDLDPHDVALLEYLFQFKSLHRLVETDRGMIVDSSYAPDLPSYTFEHENDSWIIGYMAGKVQTSNKILSIRARSKTAFDFLTVNELRPWERAIDTLRIRLLADSSILDISSTLLALKPKQIPKNFSLDAAEQVEPALDSADVALLEYLSKPEYILQLTDTDSGLINFHALYMGCPYFNFSIKDGEWEMLVVYGPDAERFKIHSLNIIQDTLLHFEVVGQQYTYDSVPQHIELAMQADSTQLRTISKQYIPSGAYTLAPDRFPQVFEPEPDL